MTTWHSLLKTTAMIRVLVESWGTSVPKEVNPGIVLIDTADGVVLFLRILPMAKAKVLNI